MFCRIQQMSTAPAGVAYGFGRDYTKGFGVETHFEKIEKVTASVLFLWFLLFLTKD